jgi:hypothetical protein
MLDGESRAQQKAKARPLPIKIIVFVRRELPLAAINLSASSLSSSVLIPRMMVPSWSRDWFQDGPLPAE